MNPEEILVVYKQSKFERDQEKLGLNEKSLIESYKKEQIDYKRIVESHKEQNLCMDLARKCFDSVLFLKTKEFKPEHSKNKKLIVSVGGDEHFKYVLHHSLPRNLLHNSQDKEKFFLSIRSDNLKSEGALSSCNRSNLERMSQEIDENTFRVELWPVLELRINNQFLDWAMDTVFVGSKYSGWISRYVLCYGERSEEQKSSGVIVATGAGSTGWLRSAGAMSFPRYWRRAIFLVREPYRGSKFVGISILQGEIDPFRKEFSLLKFHSLMDSFGIVDLDSVREYEFLRGFQLEIRVSEHVLRIVALSSS